ncbi:MAG: fibronectin type III domain-containing protein, partial [Halobacteria archaeon]|nr:fibronectin type III domain-containing protein [Halobacteria archaeon]
SAKMHGELVNLSGSSADVYFEYRQEENTNWKTTATKTLSSTGKFNITQTGLEEGEDWEFRAVATSGSVT